jgi:HD-GYP domain-containing protein (c-di-GMP phosphodiesterase class II)
MDNADESSARIVAERLHKAIPCDRVTVFRLDEAQGNLVSLFAEGIDNGSISLGMRLGIAGLVAVTGQEAVIDDAQADPRFDRRFDDATGYVTTSMMCLPINSRKGVALGAVQVINKQGGRFDATDLDVLRSLVGVIAVFIENAMLIEDQDRQFHSTLNVMAASIDAKDALTAGHSHRVATIARGIAKEMGFSDSELDVLHVAALLHDYGKIGVSDAVLKKEGKLSDDEYAHIKLHALMTHSILDKIFFARKYRAVPLIAGSHHECLDGSGYPQGLTAKQIPFMSKVLAVADVYEALTADRHYRKGMAGAAALHILKDGSGTRFDPNVIAAIERLALRGHIPSTSQPENI